MTCQVLSTPLPGHCLSLYMGGRVTRMLKATLYLSVPSNQPTAPHNSPQLPQLPQPPKLPIASQSPPTASTTPYSPPQLPKSPTAPTAPKTSYSLPKPSTAFQSPHSPSKPPTVSHSTLPLFFPCCSRRHRGTGMRLGVQKPE